MGIGAAGTHIEVDAVAYGRPATEAVAARIQAAKAGHPLDAVTVIVPSNQAGLSVRRLLGSGALGASGLANVGFVTPFRLAELLGSTELGERRPLTNPVLAAAARAVLATEPGIFAEVADHQATTAAVVELYAELSRALPATLAAIAAGSARGADVVRLVDAVRERLRGYHDEDDLARAATRRVAGDPDAARSLGAVVWHLPDRLSPAMQELVREVLRRASSSAVVAGLTGAVDADDLVLDLCASVGAPLGGDVVVAQPHAERILSVSDPDEEVRTVLREVVALAAAGTDLDRIAIFFPSAEPYARTLLEQLGAAGIPHNGPATTRLADTVAGRTLLGALGLQAAGWGRSDVLALLSGGPLRHQGRLAPSGRWDERSRDAGVVGGRDDWQVKLTAHSTHLRKRREELASAGEPERRLDRLAGEADDADGLASFVEWLALELEDLDAAPSWAARSDAARALLVALLGPEHLRTGWPDLELDAASRVDEALARLVVLDEVEPRPTPAAFEQAVRSELEARAGRVGRFGQGVLVAPLAAAMGLDLDAVFVLGMVEGTCPSFRREDTLLPDADRLLATGSELLTRQQRLGDLHRSYLSALASASRRTLLLPRGDLRDRRERLASRWLLDSLAARVGRKVFSSDVDDVAAGALEVVASYAHGIGGAAVHGSLTDRDVGALLHHVGREGDPHAHPLATGDLGRGFRCNRSRQSAAFTEWDGNLAGQVLPSPAAGHPISSSRLETWASCPFRYFMAHVLRLGDRDDPEEITEIGALDLGSLVHEVLERFVREVIERPEGAPAPAQPWTAVDRARVEEIAREVFEAYERQGLTGRPLLWRRRQAEVLDDLQAFLDADDRHRAASGARPVRVEMPFGLDGAAPLALELADGRTVSFRGKADRVDEAGDGRLVVLDYKTGRNKYAGLDTDPVLAGTTLQLGLYAEAAMAELGADEVEARYWMTSQRERFAQPGYLWTDDHRARFLEVVGAIVDGIEGGAFPGRPGAFNSFFGTHDNCGFCDFDRVCPRDRDDHQQAKAEAPELSLLARLALPAAEEPSA